MYVSIKFLPPCIIHVSGARIAPGFSNVVYSCSWMYISMKISFVSTVDVNYECEHEIFVADTFIACVFV
jgi:hypothetical protein